MIPSSRPKLSDLYTLSLSKLIENHILHSGTYVYRPNMAVSPPPTPQVIHMVQVLKSWSYSRSGL